MKTVQALLLLSLVSCGSGGGGGSSAQTKSTQPQTIPEGEEVERNIDIKVVRRVVLDPDFKNFDLYKESINEYEVIFNPLSGFYGAASVDCRKNVYEVKPQEYKTRFNNRGTEASLYVGISPADLSEVEFNCAIEENGQLLDKIKFSIKKSYVISGTKNAQAMGLDSKTIGTLVLDKDAILFTDGKNMVLKADELVSKEAKIVTFREEDSNSTLSDMNGASGGLISIETDNAFGKLQIELRGKNAGAQTKVPEKNPTLIPRHPSQNPRCDSESEGQAGRNGRHCSGRPGQQGVTGFPGFPGYNGGASGQAIFKVSQTNDLKLDIRYFPGAGSKGNVGGAGGVGQPGGIGATVSVRSIPDHHGCAKCSEMKSLMMREYNDKIKYPDGAQGPQGAQGPAGADGKNGVMDESNVIYSISALDLLIKRDWQSY